MAQYPEKRKLPPYLADAAREKARLAPDHSRTLFFAPLRGTYVSKHSGGRNVDVVSVTDWCGGDQALLFKTPLNEDLDGAPDSYAAPVSASDPSPRGGLTALDNIKNATDKKGDVFHDDPALNEYHWTGVMSATNGRIDKRPFLQDADGNFPLFQPAGSAHSGYYAPRTAIAGIDGQAVNPLEVPYGALSAMLRGNGHVDLGDFGLAVRPRTGSFTPFVYADAGGRKSNSVGECSRKMIRNLFGGSATDEDICYIVFPGSASGNLVNPSLIAPRVQQMLGDLAKFDNALEVIVNLLWPNLAETMAAMQSAVGMSDTDPLTGATAIRNYVRPPAVADLARTAAFQSILGAMRRAGFS